MNMRRSLKRAGKWNWGNTFIFLFGMITCSGYFIKHVMLVVFGIKGFYQNEVDLIESIDNLAHSLLKRKNDPFDQEVQRYFYLFKHNQSHLEHTRRMEAVIKLIPQTILQLYIIWYTIDRAGIGKILT